MKTSISKIKLVALALATIFTTSVTFAAPANNENNKPEEVRYVGNVNELPVYRLSLNSKNTATYIVSIKDNDGNILYSERVSGKGIVRNYQLDEAPSNDYSLTFEVNNITEKTNSVYNINKTKKIFDEVEVSKLK